MRPEWIPWTMNPWGSHEFLKVTYTMRITNDSQISPNLPIAKAALISVMPVISTHECSHIRKVQQFQCICCNNMTSSPTLYYYALRVHKTPPSLKVIFCYKVMSCEYSGRFLLRKCYGLHRQYFSTGRVVIVIVSRFWKENMWVRVSIATTIPGISKMLWSYQVA